MASNNESQCYFVQLQFDSYLDCELSQVQRDAFQEHLQQCVACANEFEYAQRLHDSVLDFPQLDCDDKVLEPVYRLGSAAASGHNAGQGFWQNLHALLNSIPLPVRYAVPLGLFIVLIFPSIKGELISPPAPQVVEQSAPQYSPEEVRQALADLNLAIQYLNGVSQRTEVMIGDRFLITPLQDSLDASFDLIRQVGDEPQQSDPVY